MLRLAVVLVLVGGCLNSDNTCGDKPARPGRAVAFDGDRAIMSRADYLAQLDWEQALQEWAVCVAGE